MQNRLSKIEESFSLLGIDPAEKIKEIEDEELEEIAGRNVRPLRPYIVIDKLRS